MSRNCKCSGGCCGPQTDEVNRRDFLAIVAAGATTAAVAGPAWADGLQKQVPPEQLERWKQALREPSPARLYRSGVHGDARMHLGGIGTGNIEIGCDGRFTNWQLFNTLRDGQVPLVFAVKAGDTVRLLQTAGGPDWPRVERIEMTGEYPIATLRYVDAKLPVGVELSAFTPFAPLDARFSSQPLAVLIFRLHNPTAQPQTVSLTAMMLNPVGYEGEGEIKGMSHAKLGGNVNEPFGSGSAAGLLMRAEPHKPPAGDAPKTNAASEKRPATAVAGGVDSKAPGFGTLVLVAVADTVTILSAFDDWNVAWEQLKSRGSFLPPEDAKPNPPTAPGQTSGGAVAATVDIPAGDSVEVPFLLAWHYPNKYSPPAQHNYGVKQTWIGCHYATLWPDAKAVIHEAAAKLLAIRWRTESFRKTFYQSTLPYWLLDCITSQAATIRHIGVVFRIANGDVYGWEGSNGCCNPTCTHVWGYEQSLARLFPELERDMRRIDFKHQQGPDGGVHNRTAFPSPPHPTGEQPFVDGHASCILKAYREALNHPDDSFLKQYWPHVRRAVEYLIARDAGKAGTPDGILEDDQFNTYDQALHGVTTFMSGYYLTALRAGEEWARRIDDAPTADRFHAIFLKGRENLVKRCWNGEYFQQDLSDYHQRTQQVDKWTVGEVGPGCMADQLIGQWWAHQLGLGYILPKDKVQAALRAVFKYNWVPDLTGFKQAPREFAGPGDKGLLICTWPKGGRPKAVMLYSDEVWTGIEYQVAAHMIYEGMTDEALAIVRGARDRYDGIPRKPIPRNPWNEIECGGHYARAMSSWSLLLALSGYEYDGPAKTLRFTPRLTPANFQAFFIGPEGWGSLRQTQDGQTQRNEIQVVEGRLAIARLCLAPPAGATQVKVTLGGAAVDATLKPASDGPLVSIALAAPAVVKSGETLAIDLI